MEIWFWFFAVSLGIRVIIIYLVWKENGQICNKEIKNSRVTQEHIYIKSIVVGNDGNLSVRFGSSGSYTIVAWEDKSAVNL